MIGSETMNAPTTLTLYSKWNIR